MVCPAVSCDVLWCPAVSCGFQTYPFLLQLSNQVTLAMSVGNLGGNGCSAASTSTLAIFLIDIVPRHDATMLTPVIQRVNKHYFVTSMIDHETVNYSQQSALRQPGDWCPHQNGTIQARWSAYKATLMRRIRIQSDVPTSAVVRR